MLLLAAIQFTAVLDFLIVLPLGPEYMRVRNITAQQFGVMVSAYAISAGVFGAAGGFFLDLFDRKRALLVLFMGFTLGTVTQELSKQTLASVTIEDGEFYRPLAAIYKKNKVLSPAMKQFLSILKDSIS